jgi:nucleoside-diphosphate-sugar epimerase
VKVFVTGGTGTIGFPVVKNLIEHKHEVLGLVRSEDSRNKLQNVGAIPVWGELSSPESWVEVTRGVDAVIHMALSFCDDDGPVDWHFLNCLMNTRAGLRPLRFVMTGGTWLYGHTANRVAVEDDPYDPPQAWAWWLDSMHIVMNSSNLEPVFVHPAMVWSKAGSCFGMLNDIKAGKPVRVHENADHRWPLVNDEDLAELYRLVLEKGRAGEHYNAASQYGVSIGQLAATLSKASGHHAWLDVVAIADTMRAQGNYTEGYGLDQQMSGDKAKRELGWKPQFDDILREALN